MMSVYDNNEVIKLFLFTFFFFLTMVLFSFPGVPAVCPTASAERVSAEVPAAAVQVIYTKD